MSRSARFALPVLLVALTGCASPAAPAPAPDTALSADEQAFVAQARQIAPALIGDDEKIARRGANTCTALADGRPAGEVTGQVRERFGVDQVSSAQAAQLVEAARVTVCAS